MLAKDLGKALKYGVVGRSDSYDIFVEPQVFLDMFDKQTSLQRFLSPILQVSICTWAGVTLPSTLELFSMSLGDLSSTSMMPVSQRYDFLPSSMKVLMFWGGANQFQERFGV